MRKETNIMYIPKSEEWFTERIGKRVFRDMQGETDCCNHCKYVREHGLVVADKQHAGYLADTDTEFGVEGIFSNYRDDK